MEIDGENIVDSWLNAVRMIIGYGENVIHENKLTKNLDELSLKIFCPLRIGELTIGDSKYVEGFKRKYDIDSTLDYKFQECDRIFNYYGINQFERAIERLRKKPDTRSAVISIIEPKIDIEHLTCLSLIGYKIRDNRLDATVVYRSHDYGRKALSNLVFQSNLMKKACSELKIEPGKLTCHSIISAHVNYLE